MSPLEAAVIASERVNPAAFAGDVVPAYFCCLLLGLLGQAPAMLRARAMCIDTMLQPMHHQVSRATH